MTKPTVYVETTVVSYLVAKRSRDTVTAGHQAATVEWWEKRRGSYDLCVPQEVLKEAMRGDSAYAAKRIAALAGLPILYPSQKVDLLGQELLRHRAMPAKALSDAIHLGFASFHGVRFLATWNLRHIANPATMTLARDIIKGAGYTMPEICTPEQL